MVFNLDFSALQKDLEEDDWEEVEFQLKKKKLGTSIPRDEDLHGAAQALIRLQDVYELDIRDLSKGRILSCVIQLIHLISFLKYFQNICCLPCAQCKVQISQILYHLATLCLTKNHHPGNDL